MCLLKVAVLLQRLFKSRIFHGVDLTSWNWWTLDSWSCRRRSRRPSQSLNRSRIHQRGWRDPRESRRRISVPVYWLRPICPCRKTGRPLAALLLARTRSSLAWPLWTRWTQLSRCHWCLACRKASWWPRREWAGRPSLAGILCWTLPCWLFRFHLYQPRWISGLCQPSRFSRAARP